MSGPAWSPARVPDIADAPVVNNNASPLSIISTVPLLAWYRGDSVTLATGVSQFTDKTSNGNHLVQATGSNQPAYNATDATLNNRPTLTGDGAASSMVCAGCVLGASFWACLVLKQISWTIGKRIMSSPGGAGRAEIPQAGSSPQLSQFEAGTNANGANGGAPVGSWKRVSQAMGNATTDFLLCGSVLTTGTNNNRTSTSNQLALFSAFGVSQPANVAIAEMIVTTGIPTPAEQANIDTYLSSRYLASLLA